MAPLANSPEFNEAVLRAVRTDRLRSYIVPKTIRVEAIEGLDAGAVEGLAEFVEENVPGGGIYTNVRDFGATGDGVTDDRSAIQAAIDSLAPRAGGVVFFPRGRYQLSGALVIEGATGLRLLGEAGGPFSNQSTPAENQSVLSASARVLTLNNCHGVLIESLSLSKLNNGDAALLLGGVFPSLTLRGVAVTAPGGSGVVVAGPVSPSGDAAALLVMENCLIEQAPLGLVLSGFCHARITSCRFTETHIRVDANCKGALFAACRFNNFNTATPVVRINGWATTIVGCYFTGNAPSVLVEPLARQSAVIGCTGPGGVNYVVRVEAGALETTSLANCATAGTNVLQNKATSLSAGLPLLLELSTPGKFIGVPIMRAYVDGETQPRVAIDQDGAYRIGPGGASSPDTRIARYGPGRIGSDARIVGASGLALGGTVAAGAGAGVLVRTSNVVDTAGASLGVIPIYDAPPPGPGIPAAHAPTHATGGSDPVSAASVGAETPLGAQARVDAHEADTTLVHGIANTASLILEGDARLSDARIPLAHATSHRFGGTDSSAPAFVTSVPGAPFDGQVIHFLANDAAGIVWTLRYRAGSASAYKWEFVGGPQLFAKVDTDESTSSTTYAFLATIGPAITPPLVGEYDVEWGALFIRSTAGNVGYMSYALGASDGSDNYSARASLGSASAPADQVSPSITRRAIFTSTDALVSTHRVDTGTVSFAQRWLSMRPIRVG